VQDNSRLNEQQIVVEVQQIDPTGLKSGPICAVTFGGSVTMVRKRFAEGGIDKIANH
jgi:hypothetical protein